MKAIEILLPIYTEYINDYLDNSTDRKYNALCGFCSDLKALGWTDEQDKEFIEQLHQARKLKG